MNKAIIIPARYGSSRFPGKPLADLAGKTMLQRTVEVAQEAAKILDENVQVVVSTEDDRIAAHAKEIGVMCVMTSDTCPTGTDRAYETIQKLDVKPDVVANLQGDAPLTPPDFVAELLNLFNTYKDAQVATVATQLSWDALEDLRAQKKISPFSGTTVVLSEENDGIWFSKNIIPAVRKEDRSQLMSPVYRHIGLYGYTAKALAEYVTWDMSHYETLEGLEQLRWLENGYEIKVGKVDYRGRPAMSGVDTPEDAKMATKLLQQANVA